ncbi:MAG TPA: SPOR domain-containing protein [Vicinamibacterales bacterium]|nr:SPOR domain-containing protein [Vicinamibacterales bacterium]
MDDPALSTHDEAAEAAPAAPPPRPSARRFTDEDIFAALRAGEEDGVTTAELCAAHGITLPLYCVWKRKYGTLTLDELRAVRRQEAKRRRVVVGLFVAGVATVAIGLGVVLLPGGPPTSHEAFAASAAKPAAREGDAKPAASARAPVEAAREAAAAAALAGAYNLPSEDEGLVVQVAAKPDLNEARAVVDRLTAAGHRAYLLSAAVGNLEMFRVRVGPFPTRQAAAAAIRQLEREGYEGAWLVR